MGEGRRRVLIARSLRRSSLRALCIALSLSYTRAFARPRRRAPGASTRRRRGGGGRYGRGRRRRRSSARTIPERRMRSRPSGAKCAIEVDTDDRFQENMHRCLLRVMRNLFSNDSSTIDGHRGPGEALGWRRRSPAAAR